MLDGLDIDQVTIVGNALGGMSSLWCAVAGRSGSLAPYSSANLRVPYGLRLTVRADTLRSFSGDIVDLSRV